MTASRTSTSSSTLKEPYSTLYAANICTTLLLNPHCGMAGTPFMNKNTRWDLTAASIFLKISASGAPSTGITFFLGAKSGCEDEENSCRGNTGTVKREAQARGSPDRHARRTAGELRSNLTNDMWQQRSIPHCGLQRFLRAQLHGHTVSKGEEGALPSRSSPQTPPTTERGKQNVWRMQGHCRLRRDMFY